MYPKSPMVHQFSMVKTLWFQLFAGGRARLGRGGAAVVAALGRDPADVTAEPQAAEARVPRVPPKHHGRMVDTMV